MSAFSQTYPEIVSSIVCDVAVVQSGVRGAEYVQCTAVCRDSDATCLGRDGEGAVATSLAIHPQLWDITHCLRKRRGRTLQRHNAMKKQKTVVLVAAVVAALAAGPLLAAPLKIATPFGDGMVLQRERPVPVWGKAAGGAAVEVSFAGQVKKTTAEGDGRWRVTLDPLTASKEPRRLAVSAGAEQVVFTNVVVGEVWLCSGQSNMDMAIADDTPCYGDDIGRMVAQVTDKPFVRYMTAPGKDGWHALTPAFLFEGRKAALAVHYALALYEQLDVPVGVIVAAVGGSNIDSWNPTPGAPVYAYLHHAHIVGLVPYAVRGALWYQGETNVREGAGYLPKLRQLDAGWRTLFESPDMMFGYVQLAPFSYGKKDGLDLDELFPVFLETQAAFEREQPNAAMVVINDIGNVKDVHPGHKWLIARRLLLPVLKRFHGRAGIEDHSPVPARVEAVSNVVEVAFDHAKTLYVHNPDAPGDLSVPFELEDEAGFWKPARILNYARRDWMRHGNIDTNVVQLVADGMSRPVSVRYAWRKPWKGILYNQVNLPLGTFRQKVVRPDAE